MDVDVNKYTPIVVGTNIGYKNGVLVELGHLVRNPISTCPGDIIGDKCYARCPAGFYSDPTCPNGLTMCYKECGSGFTNACGKCSKTSSQQCPQNFITDTPTSCRPNQNVLSQTSRSSWGPVNCPEKIGDNCYEKCPVGFTANGSMCTKL
jgi:hypothetical protein